MAFHPCSAFGILLVLVSVILLIFASVGQISSTQSIPRHVRLVSVDATGFGVALNTAEGNQGNLTSLYPSDGLTANQTGIGIATTYEWGLWNFCESQLGLGATPRFCNSTAAGTPFQPMIALLNDVPADAKSAVEAVIPPTTFTSNDYLNSFTSTAFYFVLVGAVIAGLALLIGFGAHRFAYLFSALLGFVAAVLIAVGGIIYSVIIAKVKDSVNSLSVTGGIPLGLVVSYGNALWMIWGAVGALLLSILPFFFACCAVRSRQVY